jgi:hypothetical protein
MDTNFTNGDEFSQIKVEVNFRKLNGLMSSIISEIMLILVVQKFKRINIT